MTNVVKTRWKSLRKTQCSLNGCKRNKAPTQWISGTVNSKSNCNWDQTFKSSHCGQILVVLSHRRSCSQVTKKTTTTNNQTSKNSSSASALAPNNSRTVVAAQIIIHTGIGSPSTRQTRVNSWSDKLKILTQNATSSSRKKNSLQTQLTISRSPLHWMESCSLQHLIIYHLRVCWFTCQVMENLSKSWRSLMGTTHRWPAS